MAATATKATRKKGKGTAGPKFTGQAARITERELATASKMAARKSGVTAAQLARELNGDVRRARSILKRTGARAEVLQDRTTVYFAP